MGYLASAVLGLYNLLNGNAIFTAYGTDLQVILGPPLERTAPIEVLVASWGENPAAEDDGTRLTQQWATMGAAGRQRDKVLAIPCAVWVIGGETDMNERLTKADEVFAAVDTLLTTADLGLGAILCGGVEIQETGVWLGQTGDGAAVAIRFTVRTWARE